MKDKTLDCSDLDRFLGKPMQPARLIDPVGNLDIRRWAQAMRYPNWLHYYDEFARKSRFGRIVAPQSFAAAEAVRNGLPRQKVVTRSKGAGATPGHA